MEQAETIGKSQTRTDHFQELELWTFAVQLRCAQRMAMKSYLAHFSRNEIEARFHHSCSQSSETFWIQFSAGESESGIKPYQRDACASIYSSFEPGRSKEVWGDSYTSKTKDSFAQIQATFSRRLDFLSSYRIARRIITAYRVSFSERETSVPALEEGDSDFGKPNVLISAITLD